jgi:hypothetical protein
MINGTTDFPAGTTLNLFIEQLHVRRDYILKTNLEVTGNNSGPNSFSYVYDMKGNSPGQYHVALGDSINMNTASSEFNITSDVSYYKWIRINPLGEVKYGEVILVSGTTDLPAGSEIAISSTIMAQSCPHPPRTTDAFGKRTFCGGNCFETGVTHEIVQVIKGGGGINTWNSSLNAADWCINEEYRVVAEATNWTNVTSDYQSFRFSS